MEKTEMMKRFEEETDIDAIIPAWAAIHDVERDEICNPEYISYLERQLEEAQAKAESYDRLMSGVLSMKELANILRHPVAIDNDEGQNTLYYFGTTPHIGQFSDGTQFWSCKRKWRLPRQLVHFNGDWTTSLTLPDGWREKCSKN